MKINQSEWCMQNLKDPIRSREIFFVSYLIRELSWDKIQKERKRADELKSKVSTVDI